MKCKKYSEVVDENKLTLILPVGIITNDLRTFLIACAMLELTKLIALKFENNEQ